MPSLSGLTPQGIMDLTDVAVCLPLVLIMNFSLFQYLVTMFFRRRREPLVALLLALAFLSFASLIPLGFPDPELVRDLNDISETCTVLTFLIQISILTRDINKKIKLKALVPLLYLGEALVLLGLAVLVCNVLDIVVPVVNMDTVEFLDDVVENASLLFIVGFRFFFLAMAKGVRSVWQTQKLEMALYMLFLTHEYPFMLLDHATGLSWEHVQGVWMRITIVLCLWMTIKARFSSRNSKMGGRSTAGGALGPSTYFDAPGTVGASNGPSMPARHGTNTLVKVQGLRPASVVPISSSVLD